MKRILTLALCAMLLAGGCARKDAGKFPDPKIVAGTAKLSGTLSDFAISPEAGPLMVELSYANLLTAEPVRYEVEVAPDGSFSFEVPVDRDPLWAGLMITSEAGYYGSVVFTLSTRREARVAIRFNGEEFEATMQGYAPFTPAEMKNAQQVMIGMGQQPPPEPRPPFTTDQDVFVERGFADLDRTLQVLRDDTLLSAAAKTCVEKEFSMILLEIRMLDYSASMRHRYRAAHDWNDEGFVAPPEPGHDFYKFLARFDLNDPQYLAIGQFYSAALQKMLTIPALGIPPIAETPVDEWMKQVKASLAPLVGFDEGQFYDLLTAAAYGRQFAMRSQPLSPRQIANIEAYFRGGKRAYADLLLRNNAEMEKLAAGVGELTVHETPAGPDDKVLDAIAADHRGKVIVVDLWATWCAPCLDAIRQIRELKAESGHDGVAWVYLTYDSPEKLWREKITGIGGDHYRLTEGQWDWLHEHFEFEGIPSYILIDPSGKVAESFTGYPGNGAMREKIAALPTR